MGSVGLGIWAFWIMEVRPYGLRGFGFLVVWLSVVCVCTLYLLLHFAILKCELYVVLCIFELGGSWVFGFLGFCNVVCLYFVFCMLCAWILCLGLWRLGFWNLWIGVFSVGFMSLVF